MSVHPLDVPVFILCGGQGTRLKEATVLVPKPMVPIGTRPILWHIMRTYAAHGFKNFILCLGYKSEIIKSYFLNYASMNSDFTVELKTNNVQVHSVDHDQDWRVTLAYTGETSMTGARVARAAARYLSGAEHFAVTYGDGLTDVDLLEEFAYHIASRKLGTVLGVNPPSRFGQLKIEDGEVTRFEEKPDFVEEWINGGYLFFRREFLSYLTTDESCVLEKGPLIHLADDRELALFKHRGFWACMDTQRDLDQLNQVWDSGRAPWMVSAGSARKTSAPARPAVREVAVRGA
jgi:glucose-1-phosphate cytidylyltransferase